MSAPPRFDEADSYEAFALAYDAALGQPFHAVIARRLDDLAARYPTTGDTHLDVACGTGLLLSWGAARGWKSVGVDASMAMLKLARERGGTVTAGDMRALPFGSASFDRITCVYDSLNHLLEADELRATFRSIASLMHEDSMFWFDVNHPDAYPQVWDSDEPFVASGDDWHLEIATSWDPPRRMAVGHVTGFASVRGRRVEIDEVHCQRPWNERQIRSLLREAGLRVVWKTRFEPFGHGGEKDGLKVLYAAALR